MYFIDLFSYRKTFTYRKAGNARNAGKPLQTLVDNIYKTYITHSNMDRFDQHQTKHILLNQIWTGLINMVS